MLLALGLNVLGLGTEPILLGSNESPRSNSKVLVDGILKFVSAFEFECLFEFGDQK